MKINQTDNLLRLQRSPTNKIDDDNEFKKIFDQKLTKIDSTLSPVLDDGRMDVVEHGDKILNLLEDYARELTDPGKSLKDIEPLVNLIEKEVNIIGAKSAQKVYHDQELEKIINDLTVTANIAVFKFHRGDFI
ncbi:MAG: hypothetical protein KKH68_06790 [Proteobacteria bacterium]|nr:hypothetical protein [Pseudomonadota bacterium]